MSDDAREQLNFYLLAQRLRAPMALPDSPHEQGIGQLSPSVAGRDFQPTMAVTQLSDELPPLQKTLDVFHEIQQGRAISPEHLLWNDDLAESFFDQLRRKYGPVTRSRVVQQLIDGVAQQRRRGEARGGSAATSGESPGEIQKAHRYEWREGWEGLPSQTPGCEPAVEWALCRIRYTAGTSLTSIHELLCSPVLGERYRKAARAIAPDSIRSLPDDTSMMRLVKAAYFLHQERHSVRVSARDDQMTREVASRLSSHMLRLRDLEPAAIPGTRGLLQLDEGRHCVFICCAENMRETASEIRRGLAIYLVARDYWYPDIANLELGYMPADDVLSLIPSSRRLRDHNPSRTLRRQATLRIARERPLLNWPVTTDFEGWRHQS